MNSLAVLWPWCISPFFWGSTGSHFSELLTLDKGKLLIHNNLRREIWGNRSRKTDLARDILWARGTQTWISNERQCSLVFRALDFRETWVWSVPQTLTGLYWEAHSISLNLSLSLKWTRQPPSSLWALSELRGGTVDNSEFEAGRPEFESCSRLLWLSWRHLVIYLLSFL